MENQEPVTRDDFDDDSFEFNIEELIPQELRSAHDKIVDEEIETQSIENPTIQKSSESFEDNDSIIDDSENINVSPESIDKLLEGDINALNKKESEQESEEEDYYWTKDEEYKDFTNALEYSGFDRAKLDSFIKKIADKSVVDQGNLVNGLRKEVDNAKRQLETYESEIAKSREAMRGIRFDEQEDVQSKYIRPAESNRNKIDSILRQEGAKLNAIQLVNINNKATLLRTLEENGVDESKSKEILTEWRAHQDTATEYNEAKQLAIKNSVSIANAKMTPERFQNILKGSLADMIEHQEYLSLKTAVTEGIDKHPDMGGVIQKGRNNLSVIIDAIQKGSEALNDSNLMSSFAKYAINAAFVESQANKAAEKTVRIEQLENSLKKLAIEYKKLSSSAGGIKGKALTPTIARAKVKEEKKSQENLVKEFEDLLKSDKPFGKTFFEEDE